MDEAVALKGAFGGKAPQELIGKVFEFRGPEVADERSGDHPETVIYGHIEGLIFENVWPSPRDTHVLSPSVRLISSVIQKPRELVWRRGAWYINTWLPADEGDLVGNHTAWYGTLKVL